MARRVLIVGGGIVGLATAFRLLQKHPGLGVTLLEKEAGPGRHQSSHNSGVLHAGLYYKPGSLKARLAVEGIREMSAFCRDHGIAHEICGKLVVATNPMEELRLKELLERANANGLRGVRLLDRAEMVEREPHVGGCAALHVPEEGILDYSEVCTHLVREIQVLGGTIKFQSTVRKISLVADEWQVETTAGDERGDFLINCAGLHSDRVAALAGERPVVKIVPFRGEYYRLRTDREHLVRHLIYPVPDPQFPFLGVHFTRQIHGGVEAGPNAVLALGREAYRARDINPKDMWDAMTYPGLWRFLGRHKRMCWDEIKRSWSRDLFCESLQKLVPDIEPDDLSAGGAGVRAQAMHPSGELDQNFTFIQKPRALHVLSAASPAATASLAIGSEIVAMAQL